MGLRKRLKKLRKRVGKISIGKKVIKGLGKVVGKALGGGKGGGSAPEPAEAPAAPALGSALGLGGAPTTDPVVTRYGAGYGGRPGMI